MLILCIIYLFVYLNVEVDWILVFGTKSDIKCSFDVVTMSFVFGRNYEWFLYWITKSDLMMAVVTSRDKIFDFLGGFKKFMF